MTLRRVSPVFPVSDLERAIECYQGLGFDVRRYEGQAPYAFAERDGVELHLAQVHRLRPKTNMSAVYLYVDDADALYEEWMAAGADGDLRPPVQTDYGLREGAFLDKDANLIRFGSFTDAGA